MGPDDVVPLAEVRAGARRHRLLTDVAVRRPLDEPGAEELRRLLVEASDPDHRGVETFERVAAERHRAPPGNWAAGGRAGSPPTGYESLDHGSAVGGKRAPARRGLTRPDPLARYRGDGDGGPAPSVPRAKRLLTPRR